MPDSPYRRSDELPTPEEYCALRQAAGMARRSLRAAQAGLPGSLFATTIRLDGELVAMGRLVGDGGCNFEVVDVAVHPEHQRRGLGTQVMHSLVTFLRERAPESAYVSLIADDHSPALYRKFGFRPTTPKSIGMALRMGPEV